jgi:phosphoglycolate phosphatase-like HAD superfamily hydrolase
VTAPRLVATDLDGTLVRTDGSISARTRAVLAAVEARGVPVVFVTGRPLRWAEEVFPVASVSPAPDGCIRLILDWGDEKDGADLLMMFNFEDQTLQVLETGDA